MEPPVSDRHCDSNFITNYSKSKNKTLQWLTKRNEEYESFNESLKRNHQFQIDIAIQNWQENNNQ